MSFSFSLTNNLAPLIENKKKKMKICHQHRLHHFYEPFKDIKWSKQVFLRNFAENRRSYQLVLQKKKKKNAARGLT